MYRTGSCFGNAKQARKKASLGKEKERRSHHGLGIHMDRSIRHHDELLSAAKMWKRLFLSSTLSLLRDKVNGRVA